MSVTAFQVFYAAYKNAGGVLLEQTGLNVDQQEEARQAYNGMVDTWRADGFTVSHVERVLFPTVASQGIYTIGPGGDWNDVWPDRIDRAGIVITNGSGALPAEYPLYPLTVQLFAEWIVKDQQTSYPAAYFYERSFPLGKVHLLYIPNTVNNVALYLERPLSQIAVNADYSTVSLDYQPGYQEALENNLAVRIAERNPKTTNITQSLINRARFGLQLLKTVNNRPLTKARDIMPAGYGGRASIYNGNRWSGGGGW